MTAPSRAQAIRACQICLAVALLSPIVSRGGDSKPPLPDFLSQAVALEKNGDYAGAERMFERALATDPDQPEALMGLGILEQTELKFPQSIKLFQKVIQVSPHTPNVDFYLGLSYYGLNDYEKALDYFNRQLAINPNSRRTHYYQAILLKSLGHNQEALEQLSDIVKVDPKDVHAWYQLALLYRALALDAYQHVVTLAPNSALMLALEASSAAQDQQFQKAIKDDKRILKMDPNFPGAHFALGEAYFRSVQYAAAEPELRLALREDPNNPMANYELGDILLRKYECGEALPRLRIGVAGNPAYLRPRIDLGKCYMALGKFEKAREVLVEAARIDPDNKQPHYLLAQVYGKLNQPAERRQQLEIFQKLDRRQESSQAKTAAKEILKP